MTTRGLVRFAEKMGPKKKGKDKDADKPAEAKAATKPRGMTEDEFALFNDYNALVVALKGDGPAPLVSRVRQ